MFEAMSVLFEDVCGELGLAQRTDPLRDLVAKKLVQYAQSGERDVLRLKERVLFEFTSPEPSDVCLTPILLTSLRTAGAFGFLVLIHSRNRPKT